MSIPSITARLRNVSVNEKLLRVVSASYMPSLALVVLIGLEVSGTVDKFLAASADDKKSVLLGAGVCAVFVWLFANFARRFGGGYEATVSCDHACACGSSEEPSDEYDSLRNEIGYEAVEIALAISPVGSSPQHVGQIAQQLSSTVYPVPDSVEQVSRHEAAHAVVAWALGATVTGIAVDPEKHSGFVMHVFPLDLPPQDRLWKQMSTYVAGNAMDQSRGVHREDSWVDFENVINFAVQLISIGVKPTGYDGELMLDALVAGATRQAESILGVQGELIERVTEALVATNKMDSHGFLALAGMCPPGTNVSST